MSKIVVKPVYSVMAFAEICLEAKTLEKAGDLDKAASAWYAAQRSALYRHMWPVDSDMAKAVQQSRHRCYRKMIAARKGGEA